MHTAALLDALRARLNLPSDYALAPVLNVSRSQISAWRHGKDPMSEKIAEHIADILDTSPAYVLACVAADRSKSARTRQAWAEVAKKLAGVSAAVLLISLSAQPLDALARTATAQGLYIMLSRWLRGFAARWQGFASGFALACR